MNRTKNEFHTRIKMWKNKDEKIMTERNKITKEYFTELNKELTTNDQKRASARGNHKHWTQNYKKSEMPYNK